MTDYLFDTSPSGSDLFLFQDDGILGNAAGQLAVASGGFAPLSLGYPDGTLTVRGAAGQDYLFDLPDSLAACSLAIGDLAAPASSPDRIWLQTVTTTGVVQLAAQKTISESGADVGIDVTAGRLALSAGEGIGATGPIETRADFLEARTESGDIRIVNYGALIIGDAHAGLSGVSVATTGSVDVTAYGSITLAQADWPDAAVRSGETGGDICLAALGYDSSLAGAGFSAAARAEAGSIRLDAGADILLGVGLVAGGAGNNVLAAGSAVLNAGRDVYIDGTSMVNADNFGTASGAGVEITAGRNIYVADAYGDYASVTAYGSAGADVNLRTGANGGLFLSAPSALAVRSTSGDVTIGADVVAIEADSGISAAGAVTLRPATAGRAIDLGGAADLPWALSLSEAELDRVFASRLVVGGATAGDITVTSSVSPDYALNFELQSGGDIVLAAGASVGATIDLVLRAGDDILIGAGAGLSAGGAITAYVDFAGADDLVGGRSIVDAAFAGSVHFIGGRDLDTLNGGAGNDTLEGGKSADVLRGGAGNDTYVLSGADQVIELAGEGIDTVQSAADYFLGAELENVRLTGGADALAYGNELDNRLIGNKGLNNLVGVDGADWLAGGRGDDYLTGGAGKDTIDGGVGSDLVFGGLGNDTLAGGAGWDAFVFDTAPSSAFNRDTIEDFNPAEDIFWLTSSAFPKLPGGSLAASNFVVGSAAADFNDFIIYDDTTGALYYDRDGRGSAQAVQFAMLDPGLALTAADFLVF